MKRLILALLVCAARGLCIASAEGVIANVASRGFDVFLRRRRHPARDGGDHRAAGALHRRDEWRRLCAPLRGPADSQCHDRVR